jgi:hypothetical protein
MDTRAKGTENERTDLGTNRDSIKPPQRQQQKPVKRATTTNILRDGIISVADTPALSNVRATDRKISTTDKCLISFWGYGTLVS